MSKAKIHMLAFRDSLVITGTLVLTISLLYMFFKIAGGLHVRSEAFYRGQEMLRSYNVNHVLRESKHIYQGGEE